MTAVKSTAVIGLGGNLENPQIQVQRAIQALSELPQTQLLKASRLYASKPQGPQDQPDFINAVAIIQTALNPYDLLAACQELESTLGKRKVRHWGERLIDLDILLYDDVCLQTPQLTLPHAFLAQRDFVLLPLQEIWPDCDIVNLGKVTDLVNNLTETFVLPIDPFLEKFPLDPV
jgi:2-amino-4-hydroxy-6-hydroxymethyldihydropteridine diphosphokinase